MPENIGQTSPSTFQTIKHKVAESLKSVALRFGVWKVKPTQNESSHFQPVTGEKRTELPQTAIDDRKVEKAPAAHTLSHTLPLLTRSQSVPPAAGCQEAFREKVLPLQKSVSDNFEVLGGHAATLFASLNSSQIAKRTSLSEEDIYKRSEELGLNHVLAKHATISSHSVKSMPQDEQVKIQKLEAAKQSQETVLVLEKLGGNIKTENKRELDIKIGHATASKSQLKNTGHKSPLKKKLRMKAVDLLTRTNKRGFRLIGGKVHGNKIKGSRAKLGWATESTMAKILTLPKARAAENFDKILTDLNAIKRAVTASPVTFIGCSVLLVVDDKNPEKTEAKLIDFRNPIHQGEPNFDKSKHRFVVGLENLIQEMKKLRFQ